MEEKLLKEILGQLKEISESLVVHPGTSVRGPVADPGPEFRYRDHVHRRIPIPIGYDVDPAPEFYLSKELMAQVKVREMDMTITQISEQLKLLELQRDLMKKEYDIK